MVHQPESHEALLAGALAAVLCSPRSWQRGGRRGGGRCRSPARRMLLAGDASYTLRRARLAAWALLPAREGPATALRVDRVFPIGRRSKILRTGRPIVRAGEHLPELAGQRIYFSVMLAKGKAAPIRSTVITAVGVLTPLPENPPATSFDGYPR